MRNAECGMLHCGRDSPTAQESFWAVEGATWMLLRERSRAKATREAGKSVRGQDRARLGQCCMSERCRLSRRDRDLERSFKEDSELRAPIAADSPCASSRSRTLRRRATADISRQSVSRAALLFWLLWCGHIAARTRAPDPNNNDDDDDDDNTVIINNNRRHDSFPRRRHATHGGGRLHLWRDRRRRRTAQQRALCGLATRVCVSRLASGTQKTTLPAPA